MESKAALSTTITTVSVIVLTLALVVSIFMSENATNNIFAGTLLIGCLVFFAAILTKKGAVDYNKKATYEIN